MKKILQFLARLEQKTKPIWQAYNKDKLDYIVKK